MLDSTPRLLSSALGCKDAKLKNCGVITDALERLKRLHDKGHHAGMEYKLIAQRHLRRVAYPIDFEHAHPVVHA